MKSLKLSLVGLLFFSLLNVSAMDAMSAPVKVSSETKAVSSAPVAEDKDTKTNSNQKLHRADFRVTGASCVACLRRIGKTLREQHGVLKADISIFKPYWAIVVYDANATNMDKLYEVVKAEKVKFEEMEDKAISSLPLIIIPKGMAPAPGATSSAPSSSGNSGATSGGSSVH